MVRLISAFTRVFHALWSGQVKERCWDFFGRGGVH